MQPTSPPPPYARNPPPEITILLLGSPNTGKQTFLSTLPRVRNGHLQHQHLASPTPRPTVSNPTTFSVTLYNRLYDITIHRSESTLFIDPFPPHISFAIFTYAIDSRESLYNAQFYWRRQFADRYEREQGLTVPVMLLGLKRDLRMDEMRVVDGNGYVAEVGGREVSANAGATQNKAEQRREYVCVMPEEGLKVAQEMRCDKYAECSAVTGELMWEVLEDITRTAALTTTEKGGLSEGNCVLM